MTNTISCPICGEFELRLRIQCDACGTLQPPPPRTESAQVDQRCVSCDAEAPQRLLVCGTCGSEARFEELRKAENRRFRRRAAILIMTLAFVAAIVGGYLWYDNWNLAGKDLSGQDLSGRHLSGRNLSRSNLTGAILAGANLSGANLSGAVLANANLDGADLSGANLSGANLSGAKLVKAQAPGADFFEANLTTARLLRANLTNSHLDRSRLFGASLERADLTGVTLAGAALSEKTSLFGATGLTDAALAGALDIPASEVAKTLIEKDLRVDDKNVIARGVDSVCVGGVAPDLAPYPGETDYHPIIAFSMAEPSTKYTLDHRYSTLGWEPMLRRHAQLVVCSDSGSKVIQHCPGEWRFEEDNRRVDLRRVQSWSHIRVIAGTTGQVVADINLDGPAPPVCPYRSSTSDETGAMRGGEVSFDQYRAAIEAYVAGR